MGVATAIALGGLALGAATTVKGEMDKGAAGAASANAAKKAALLDQEKYQVNAVLATYEANRIRDETKLDSEYLGFATERQAKWLSMTSEYGINLKKAKVASQYSGAVSDAIAQAQDATKMAELQAGYVEGQGRQKLREKRMETKLKVTLQDEENAQRLGLKRASVGTRMVEFSGSTLDVLAHEEAMATIRQATIGILGGMQADDIQYDTAAQANYIRQKASIGAQAVMRRVGDGNPLDDPLLQAELLQTEISDRRDIALTEEEGWRTIMKMRMGSENTASKAVLTGYEQLTRASGSMAAADQYGRAESASSSSSITRAGSSLLTGAYEMFKVGKDAGLFKSTPSTPAGGTTALPMSTQVNDNYAGMPSSGVGLE